VPDRVVLEGRMSISEKYNRSSDKLFRLCERGGGKEILPSIHALT
jgi:hypothetical protein